MLAVAGNREVRHVDIRARLLGGGQVSILRKRKLGTHKSNVDEVVDVRMVSQSRRLLPRVLALR